MKKALILNETIVDVCENEFEVHESMFWVDCPNECSAEEWEYKNGFIGKRQTLRDYKSKRAMEYPPFADYLDGIVKGDQAQVQVYIDACLAVKAKYPKNG